MDSVRKETSIHLPYEQKYIPPSKPVPTPEYQIFRGRCCGGNWFVPFIDGGDYYME